MIETFDLAGYCRISVDEELDRDNTSIENQKAIIEDFVRQKFPGSTLTFYEDRDKSGYTFDQRPGYQEMRRTSPDSPGGTVGGWWSWRIYGMQGCVSSPLGTGSTFLTMTTG